MTTESIFALIGVIGTVIGAFVGLGGYLKGRDESIKQASEWKGEKDSIDKSILTTLQILVSKTEKIENKLDDYTERLVVVEQSVKHAHKRIDDILNNK